MTTISDFQRAAQECFDRDMLGDAGWMSGETESDVMCERIFKSAVRECIRHLEAAKADEEIARVIQVARDYVEFWPA